MNLNKLIKTIIVFASFILIENCKNISHQKGVGGDCYSKKIDITEKVKQYDEDIDTNDLDGAKFLISGRLITKEDSEDGGKILKAPLLGIKEIQNIIEYITIAGSRNKVCQLIDNKGKSNIVKSCNGNDQQYCYKIIQAIQKRHPQINIFPKIYQINEELCWVNMEYLENISKTISHQDIIEFLHKLHSIDLENQGWLDQSLRWTYYLEYDFLTDLVNIDLERTMRKSVDVNIINLLTTGNPRINQILEANQGLSTQLQPLLQTRTEKVREKPLKLVHLDLNNPLNHYLTESGVQAIDWKDIGFTKEPYIDLAGLIDATMQDAENIKQLLKKYLTKTKNGKAPDEEELQEELTDLKAILIKYRMNNASYFWEKSYKFYDFFILERERRNQVRAEPLPIPSFGEILNPIEGMIKRNQLPDFYQSVEAWKEHQEVIFVPFLGQTLCKSKEPLPNTFDGFYKKIQSYLLDYNLNITLGSAFFATTMLAKNLTVEIESNRNQTDQL